MTAPCSLPFRTLNEPLSWYSDAEMSNTLTIEYGDDVLYSLGLTREAFSKEAKLLLAAKLYELGRLSSGEAARFGGLDRVQFLFELGRLGIPASNLLAEDLAEELSFALDE